MVNFYHRRLCNYPQTSQCTTHYYRRKCYPDTSLRHSETRYNTFDRELLGIYLSIKHFRHFVEGRSSPIINLSLMHWQHDLTATLQGRRGISISFPSTPPTSDMSRVHATPWQMINVGAVSSSNESPPIIDFKAMAESQASDQELQQLRTTTSLSYLSPCPTVLSYVMCPGSVHLLQ